MQLPPEIGLPFSALKEGLDLRIDESLFHDVVTADSVQTPDQNNEYYEMDDLFSLYLNLRKRKPFEVDAKAIVFSSVQKILEASLDQKVKERDREEAIQIVLHSLSLV